MLATSPAGTTLTHLQAVYKGVRAWSRRTLEKAGERVMDVAGDEEDDDDDVSDETGDVPGPSKSDSDQ